MADPAPAAPPSPAPASPAPAPAAWPGSLTGTRYDAPISDAQFDRLGPQEQSKFARVRDAANNPTWQPRSDLAPDANPGAPKPAAAPGEPPAPPAAPAASVVDGKLRVGEYELSSDDIANLMRTRAELDLRPTQVPADASGYKPDLPADLKLPAGIEVKIDTSDPSYRDLAAFAHARGWSQSDLSAALGIFASREAREAAAFAEAQRAEVQKLGANGTSRVTAVETWLRSELGDDLANGMRSMMVTEKIVRGFEKLAAQRTTQGAAPFSQAHRTPEPYAPGRVSDEEYSRMSQADRWAYARSHDQKQFYPGGNGER
jgi:hypothetical protein